MSSSYGGATASSSLWSFGAVSSDDTAGLEGDVEESEVENSTYFQGGKDCVIFLIDCSPAMFEPAPSMEEDDTDVAATTTATSDDATEETRGATPRRSYFAQCIRAAYNTLSNKIVCSEKDLVGIVLYGTDKHKNKSEFEHVFVLQDLDMPDAERILELENLLAEDYDFDANIGRCNTFSLSDALWTCANMFADVTTKVASRRVLIFTNNDDPHADDDGKKKQAITKARDVRDLDIAIDLLHLARKGRSFDVKKFFHDVVSELPPGEDYSRPAQGFDDLLTRVRSKAHQKRALMTIPLTLCDGMEIGVKVYNLVSEATKSSQVWLDRRDNSEVNSKTRYYCRDSTVPLLHTDIKAGFQYGGEMAVFDRSELPHIKSFGPPGLLLMGFKPRERLKKWYQVKHSSFIYPDETVIKGSTNVFAALLDRCLSRDKIPICRFIPRVTSSPYFVALLPQRELLDEYGDQLVPPGFHVVYLPYADDLRKLSYERGYPAAQEEAVTAMRKVVSSLLYSKFSPDNFENPALQKHFRVLEALALDKEEPEEFEDNTEPEQLEFPKKTFKHTRLAQDILYPPSYDPTKATAATKRSATGASSAAKRAKLDVADVDMAEHYKQGKVSKLTVPVLKEWLKNNDITPEGRKSDLVALVEKHFADEARL